MANIPRIITVDPTGRIAQQVRSAIELLDRLIIQIDVPGGADAIAEIKNGGCQAVIAAWATADRMPGWELAAEIKKLAPDAAVIIVADYDDTELDDETLDESPFAYFQRPFDPEKFLRALRAAIDGEDVLAVLQAPPADAAQPAAEAPQAPIPAMPVARAEDIVQGLLTDLNAIAILLVDRAGTVLLERGALGFLNRDELAKVLQPAVITNNNLRNLLSGNLAALQFYDGDEYDLYLLTVGLHHYLIMLYDGKRGSRELGNVRIFGRRAAEDLIALVGAQAWMMMQPVADEDDTQEEEKPRRRRPVRSRPEPDEEDDDDLDLSMLDRARFEDDATDEAVDDAHQMDTTDLTRAMEAIDDDSFDPDLLFGDDDVEMDDDLFSLDKVEEIARSQPENRSGVIDDEEARRLGLIE